MCAVHISLSLSLPPSLPPSLPHSLPHFLPRALFPCDNVPCDLSAFDGIRLWVRGDGQRYKMNLRDVVSGSLGVTGSLDCERGTSALRSALVSVTASYRSLLTPSLAFYPGLHVDVVA